MFSNYFFILAYLLFFLSNQVWYIWDNNICWVNALIWHLNNRQAFLIDETGAFSKPLNKYKFPMLLWISHDFNKIDIHHKSFYLVIMFIGF